jgi:formyltetrahydrofolate-dependent phosphoribosylglycinamide formyltransferase
MNIAILLSGTGSTYAAISHAIDNTSIPNAHIVRVISSRPDAKGLELATTKEHPQLVIDPKDPSHHETINQQLLRDDVDLVVMAGYMHLWKLSPSFENKVINVHPSLIPAFCGKGMYGTNVHKAVIKKGVKFSGCTVHLVDGEYDHGQILEQRTVAVESTDTPNTLAAKVGATEKALLIHVIANWDDYRP